MAALAGKVALITGASSGIGREAALRLIAADVSVTLVARRTERLNEVAAEIRSRGGKAEAVPCDVTKPGALDAAVAHCVRAFGRLDILVNNAGEGLFATVDQTTVDDLQRMLALNLGGTFAGIKAALPVMRAQGTGHIINVASTAGLRGSPFVGAYCASKFAVVGLTEALRVELLGSGITASLVCPGATRTDFFRAAIRRTDRHAGLVGPVESAADVAARIVRVARRRSARAMAQPIRRAVFLVLNIIMPGVVDRLLARMLNSHTLHAVAL